MSDVLSSEQGAALLKQMRDVLIITHKNPDGDTLGSGFGLWAALRQIGIRSKVVNEGKIADRFDFMTKPYAEQADTDFEPLFVVAVDTAATKLIGDSLCEKYGGRVDLCIDHHGSNETYAKNTVCDPASASTCEIIAEITELLGAELDMYIAKCVYTGLATDTGCFKYSNTTAKSHLLAARLIDIGVDFAELNRLFFETKSRQRAALEQMAVAGMEFAHDGKIAIITVTKDMLARAGCDPSDIEGITPISRTIEGVEVGVTMRELNNGNFKVSLRTVTVDAARICAMFGGGGHPRASGFECGGTAFDIKVATIKAIEKVLD
ncbi:MAG: bifunctional oligoribonuclease/PAP phosphatase NrnA [Oscillospiraceae bacterium]